MSRRAEQYLRNPAPAKNNFAGRAAASRRMVAMGKRARVSGTILRGPYMPPEKWYEPSEVPPGKYKVIHQQPGKGYRHVVTEEEVRDRLAQLPEWMVRPLEIVQLSRMTHKKRRAACYGMQWGTTIYLYPIEENLIETFCAPPKPSQKIEAAMFGGRWEQHGDQWKLVWSEESIRDFYLNNVLIHELGHILDDRNTSYMDRERYAEWFALEHGYKPSRRKQLAEKAAAVWLKKRHHKP
jgi:hypothetical protein